MTRQILKESSLADVFSDVKHDEIGFQCLAGRGPNDLSGSIVWYQTPAGEVPNRLGYYADEQKWTPVGDGSLLWIGIDTANPPSAADMRRRKVHRGYNLELNVGGEWTIPIIRRPDGSTGLPGDMYIDGAGKLCKPIKAAYERYWANSAEVCQWFFSDGDVPVEEVRALTLAVEALSLNYRYGMQEQAVVRAIDEENYLTLLMLTVDLPRVRQEQEAKKKT